MGCITVSLYNSRWCFGFKHFWKFTPLLMGEILQIGWSHHWSWPMTHLSIVGLPLQGQAPESPFPHLRIQPDGSFGTASPGRLVRKAWLLVSFTCSMPRPSNTAGVAWTAAWDLNGCGVTCAMKLVSSMYVSNSPLDSFFHMSYVNTTKMLIVFVINL